MLFVCSTNLASRVVFAAVRKLNGEVKWRPAVREALEKR